MENRVVPPPQASARQTQLGECFDRTLFSALDAVEQKNIPYALIGGIAASGLGRPRSTHDIDIFVRPEDAEAALVALEQNGFEPERFDPRWLFKGWKEQMMVDIIFKSEGDIYFDDEMQSRAQRIQYHGRSIPVVSPEDLIIIKSAVHSEIGPHHWHDALAILSHASVDWDYLLKRSRRAARRVLALLIYAQSNDIWIPNSLISELFRSIFGENPSARSTLSKSSIPIGGAMGRSENLTTHGATVGGSPLHGSTGALKAGGPDPYLAAHVRDAIAQDSRTAALDLNVAVSGRKIVLKGEMLSDNQIRAVEEVVRAQLPDHDIESQLRTYHMKESTNSEDVL